jgi:hypothetical protein
MAMIRTADDVRSIGRGTSGRGLTAASAESVDVVNLNASDLHLTHDDLSVAEPERMSTGPP